MEYDPFVQCAEVMSLQPLYTVSLCSHFSRLHKFQNVYVKSPSAHTYIFSNERFATLD